MAARFARALNCKRLILTHFSQRYKDAESCLTNEDESCCVEKLLLEAKDAIGDEAKMDIELAKDLKVFTISPPL